MQFSFGWLFILQLPAVLSTGGFTGITCTMRAPRTSTYTYQFTAALYENKNEPKQKPKKKSKKQKKTKKRTSNYNKNPMS